MERGVLVIGGGVSGIAAALELAGSGFPVYLSDRSQYIGGNAVQMDRWFPDNLCQMCRMLPDFSRDECSSSCLRNNLAHPNIELITGATVQQVTGDAGNFQVALQLRSGWVRAERCTGCGQCVPACPVEVPDEFNASLLKRKAIYSASPMAIPHTYVIDRDNCDRCGKCAAACPTGAIDLSLADTTRQLAVGAIIVSSGSEAFNPARMGQYGFGRYPNVITSIQLERMLDPGGAWEGRPRRPSDGKAPERIAFLQCIGSRDSERDYCSKVCCMSALKEAMLINERNSASTVEIFYLDMRDYGKSYHRYFRKAQNAGIRCTVCRVPVVRQSPLTRNLTVLAQSEAGSPESRDFDLVVLSVGQCASPDTAALSRVLGVGVNRWDFLENNGFFHVRTNREGIYVCGSAIAPADISETVSQATAAAGEASALLSPVRTPAGNKAESPVPDNADARVAVFMCRCGDEIASTVDMKNTADFVRRLSGVVRVENVDYLCQTGAQDKVTETIAGLKANRIVFAACSLYRHQFERAVRDAGVDPSLCQTVSLREDVARVHRGNPDMATDKAKRMVAMSIERLRGQEPLPVSSSPVNQTGLVIGGGISGMVAALCLAARGLEVCLVERSATLGGETTNLHYRLGAGDPQAFLQDIRKKVEADPRIHVFMQAEVARTTGYAGNFQTEIATADGAATVIDHGAVIIATGALDYQPAEYLYGQDARVITAKELHRRLAEGSLGQPSTVVMIQCVGSRDDARPYCSRTCCPEAIASSLRIKQICPQTRVFILYRDLMTCGFEEEHYTQAREAGVVFIRYTPDSKPKVNARDEALLVTADDPVLGERLEIGADLLVLGTGIMPADNHRLADIFGIELDDDGFFKEASKFRPVDSKRDGVFICGRANAPVSLEEATVQAQAAAHRAASILARDRLDSGRAISEVNERTCRGCGLCVTACAYSAREIDEERKVAVVRESICHGCGACAAICPNGAAKLRGLKEKQVFAMLDVALESRRTGDGGV